MLVKHGYLEKKENNSLMYENAEYKEKIFRSVKEDQIYS